MDEAARLLLAGWGRTGVAHELGSHQDRNYLVESDDGRFVLKIARHGITRPELEAENAGLAHLAAAGLSFAVPMPVPALDGSLIVAATTSTGATHDLRLVTFIEGVPLEGEAYFSAVVLRAHGAMGAELALALAGFDHPGLDRAFQWDLKHAADICEALAPFASTPERRSLLDASIARAMTALEPLIPRLRVQVVHADVTDQNTLGTRDAAGRPCPRDHRLRRPLADVARVGPRRDDRRRHMFDVAHPLRIATELTRGATGTLPRTEAELAALWPLVVARAASVAISGDHQASLEPDNAYVIESRQAEWAALEAVAAVSFALATEVLREAAGVGPVERPLVKRATAPVLDDAPVPMVLDLSTTSDALDGLAIGDPAAVGPLVQAAEAVGCMAVGRWARRGSSTRCSTRSRKSLDPPRHRPVRAGRHPDPCAGRRRGPASPVGWSSAASKTSSSRASSRRARKGARSTRATWSAPSRRPGRTGCRRTSTSSGSPNRTSIRQPRGALARRGVAAAVPRPVGDPRPRAGRRRAPPDDPAALLGRRDAVLATTQEHYFDAPPRIERGWRHHLFDTRGRARVDMVNNVAVIGHSHPAVEAAVARQLRLLNTNSRFLYEPMVAFAEALAARFPAPLDTVFLVNTGSESVELAIRLARTATGQEDVIAIRGAYHGWTVATDAITTSVLDNPRALETRPGWATRSRRPTCCAAFGARTPARATRRTSGGWSRSSRWPVAARRRSSPRRCSATRAGSCSRTGTCARPMRRCGARAGSRSPTRSRWATGGSARTAGRSSSRACCRTS